MKSFLDKIFLRSNNLDHISKNIKNLTQKTPSHKIFEAINSFSQGVRKTLMVKQFVKYIVHQKMIQPGENLCC